MFGKGVGIATKQFFAQQTLMRPFGYVCLAVICYLLKFGLCFFIGSINLLANIVNILHEQITNLHEFGRRDIAHFPFLKEFFLYEFSDFF